MFKIGRRAFGGQMDCLFGRLGEADRLGQMKHLWPKMVTYGYKNLFSG